MTRLRNFVFAVLIALFLSASAAQARDPQEALSSRPDGAVYIALRMDDLGGILRTVFSPANIEMLTAFASPEEAQGFRLFGSVIAQLPVQSVSLVAGTAADKTPFLQLAIAVPDKYRSKLDLVAAGKATPEDLVTLVLGEGALLLAGVVPPPALQQGEKGPYYLIENEVAISAKDDLLLMTLSSKDLQDALSALEDVSNRLKIPRRFESPNYYFLHVDMPTIVALSSGEISQEVDVQVLKDFFKAPLDVEVAFDSQPGSFLVSCAANVLEAIAGADRFKDLKPVPGAGMFLAGEGKVLLGLAGKLLFDPTELKAYPEIAQAWAKIVQETSKKGITESDIVNLLTGSFSLVAGSHATVLGKPVPGVYVALNGKDGAAAKILDKILAIEDFTKSVSIAPLKKGGWDRLFMVDPTMVPAPILFGVKDDTLFVGVIDADDLDKTPELSPAAAKLLKNDLFAGGFVDAAAIWDYLRQQVSDKNSHIGAALASIPAEMTDLVRNVLNADLSVNFLQMWAPTLDTSFIEMTVVDVPEDRRLLPRLFAAANALDAQGGMPGDDEASPLPILLGTRELVEQALAQDPKMDLEELEDEFSDRVIFLETAAGDLYIGTPVTGGDKLGLIEQARNFGLTGSAGPTLAPTGEAYDGQEIVWIKIAR